MGNQIFLSVLSLSISGTLVALLLLAFRPFTQKHFSKKWNYYIWLLVIIRLILPFHLETNLLGSAFSSITQTFALLNEPPSSFEKSSGAGSMEEIFEYPARQNEEMYPQESSLENGFKESGTQSTILPGERNPLSYAWILWIMGALLFFVVKIVDYRNFASYIKAGNSELTDAAALTLLDDVSSDLNIRRNVRIYKNSMIISPMLLGLIHPILILPEEILPTGKLRYIFSHELTHLKRGDLWYKWLFQIVWCIHWFNPFLYLLNKKLNIDCELSCDENVIAQLGEEERKVYGNMLLDTAEMNIRYRCNVLSTTLVEDKKNLKERLKSIMNYKKNTNLILIISLLCVVIIVLASALIGTITSDKETITDDSSDAASILRSSIFDDDYADQSFFQDLGDMGGSIGRSIGRFVSDLAGSITENVVDNVINNISYADWDFSSDTLNNINKKGKAYLTYDDDELIAGEDTNDKWSAHIWMGKGINGFDCNTLYFNGSDTLLILYANKTVTIELESSFETETGRFKLVQVSPDKKVSVINEKGGNLTKTLTLAKGRNVIKMVGQAVKVRQLHVAFGKLDKKAFSQIYASPEEEKASYCLSELKKGAIDIKELMDCLIYMEEEDISECILELLRQKYPISKDDLTTLVIYSDSDLTGEYLIQELKKGTKIQLTAKQLIGLAPYFDYDINAELLEYLIKNHMEITDSEFRDMMPYLDSDYIGDILLSLDKAKLSYDYMEAAAPYIDSDDLSDCVLKYLENGGSITKRQLESLLPYMDTDDLPAILKKMSASRMITKEQSEELMQIWY